MAVFLLLAATARAFGMCDELPVTPSSLDTDSYTFAVSTNTATNGVAFHIIITAKKSDIDTNYCSARLDTVRHQNGSEILQEPFETAIPAVVQKRPLTWTADFVISNELLKNPDLYFVFWEQAVDRANGKITPMAAGDFYELRLMDFVRNR